MPRTTTTPRTEWLPGGRCTPEELAKIRELMEDSGQGFSALVSQWLKLEDRSLVYYAYELSNGQWQEAASESISEAVENCEFHGTGRWIVASSLEDLKKALAGQS